MKSRIDTFDESVDAFAGNLRGHSKIDRGAYLLTETANHSLIWHIANVALWATGQHRRSDALRLAAILGVESALVNGVIKNLFKRKRPVADHTHPHRLRKPKTTSFPSGHATSAFCAATILSQGRSTPTKAAWFGLATLVSWTRIHVRIHHASDVAGGALLGLIFGQLAKRGWPTNR